MENDNTASETRTVGDQALRVVDKTTETMGIEGDHCQEAVSMNTAAARAVIEGITVEKQGEEVENTNGSGGGHASVQVLRVGGPALSKEGYQNRTKSVQNFTTESVENDDTAENIHLEKLIDAGEEGDDPVSLRDALKETELKDAVNNAVGDHHNDVGTCNMKSAGWRSVHKTRSAAGRYDEESTEVQYTKKYAKGDNVKTYNQEGGHALKSLLPEVKGSALHGADVWGGHAQLLGARPGEVRDQGVGQPRHEDVGYIPTNDVHTVKKRAEEQAAMRNYYVKSTAGKQYKTTRNMELPRHRALITLRCPEDSMGGDIVEGPVVFSLKSTTRYGRSTR